jgi:Tubulin binding cofactor C
MLSQSKIAASQDFLLQFNSRKESLKKETNLKSQKVLLSEMQKQLNSASFLPAYDQQGYSSFIREEFDRISAAEGEGRKKFSFKKTPKTAVQVDLEASKSQEISRKILPTPEVPPEIIKNKVIVMDGSQTDLTLKNYESCVISFTHPLTSLFLSNLKNCIVGPVQVETSILIQDLVNVKLQISSRLYLLFDNVRSNN